MKLIKLSQNRKYDHLSEEEQIRKVQRNPYILQYITNPSEEVQLAAVKEYGLNIEFIPNPSLEVQLAAITGEEATHIIKYVKDYIPNQHPELVKEYVKWILTKHKE